jgi:hypothetical protein
MWHALCAIVERSSNGKGAAPMTRAARRCMLLLLLITGTVIALGLMPETSLAASFLNSSETMCNGTDPTVVMCDDFEDADWAQTNCAGIRNGATITTDPRTYAANDGWCLNVFYPENFTGTNNFTVSGGAAGTARAATSSVRIGNAGMMASHGLPGDYTDIYVRLYIYFASDYVGGHEKMLDFLPVNWNPGGGDIIALGYNYFGNNEFCWIPYKYQDGGRAGIPGGAWMCQNKSNGTGVDSMGRSTPTGAKLFWQTGHWYYIEVHMKLNTGSNFDGKYDLWMDDCGTDGRGCTGVGTLRASYSDIKYWTPADVGNYGGNTKGIWIESWSNPPSLGTTHYDQIVVATRRIGPMGTVVSTRPAAPAGLTVR